LNIVCFRFHPPGRAEGDLDDLNRRLGAMVLEDGRVFYGTTEYAGKVAFRPAIVNWRSREEDVDLIVTVTRELGSKLLASTAQGRWSSVAWSSGASRSASRCCWTEAPAVCPRAGGRGASSHDRRGRAG